MMITKIDLNEFATNRHSQNGEDGILDKLFSIIGITKGYFCEFGAWDGIHLSNTYKKYEESWNGCYIEGDANKFIDLCKNITRDGVRNINM